MTEYLDNVAFILIASAIMGLILLAIGGMFELIDYLTEGKFKNCIINFFSEGSDK